MRKKLFLVLAVVCCVAVFIGMFAGCNNGDGKGGGGNGEGYVGDNIFTQDITYDELIDILEGTMCNYTLTISSHLEDGTVLDSYVYRKCGELYGPFDGKYMRWPRCMIVESYYGSVVDGGYVAEYWIYDPLEFEGSGDMSTAEFPLKYEILESNFDLDTWTLYPDGEIRTVSYGARDPLDFEQVYVDDTDGSNEVSRRITEDENGLPTGKDGWQLSMNGTELVLTETKKRQYNGDGKYNGEYFYDTYTLSAVNATVCDIPEHILALKDKCEIPDPWLVI